jgi:hypothetical protein
MHSRLTTTSAALLTLTSAIAAQTTTVIACGRDNTLYQSATGAFSNALGESVFVGVSAQGQLRRALLWFDVAAALPPGARVITAELRMEIVFSPALSPTPLFLHRPLLPWGEGSSYATAGGGGQGAPSTPGDATWTHAIDPILPWTTPGGDFAPQPSAILELPVAGTVLGFVDAGEVQQWLYQPSTNLGWLLKTPEASSIDRARRLESRESPGSPPQLRVQWLLPGSTGTFGSGCPLAGGPLQTAFVGIPQGGAPIAVQQSNAPPGAVGVTFYALALDPVGTLLAPACRLHLPLGGALIPGDAFVTSASGVATSSLQLPAGFPGALVVGQAAVLDGSALGFATGNAALLVVQ